MAGFCMARPSPWRALVWSAGGAALLQFRAGPGPRRAPAPPPRGRTARPRRPPRGRCPWRVARDVDDFVSGRRRRRPGRQAADEVAHVVARAPRVGRSLSLGKGLHHLAGAMARNFGGSRPNCDESCAEAPPRAGVERSRRFDAAQLSLWIGCRRIIFVDFVLRRVAVGAAARGDCPEDCRGQFRKPVPASSSRSRRVAVLAGFRRHSCTRCKTGVTDARLLPPARLAAIRCRR